MTNPFDTGWRVIYETESLEKASKCLEYTSNLVRCISPIHVIDEIGLILKRYDPKQDTRLPGCRYELIVQLAYRLWERAGRPEAKFWTEIAEEIDTTKCLYDLKELLAKKCDQLGHKLHKTPDQNDIEFWHQAESNLVESNGIF